MRSSRLLLPFAALPVLLLSACGGGNNGGSDRKPIVLGDSATIVTETDPQLLVDIVPPLNTPGTAEPQSAAPTPAAAAAPDTVSTPPPAETPKPEEKPAAQPAAVAGYTVDFGEVKVTLAGGNIRDRGRKFTGANSASVAADKTEYTGTGIQVTGATVNRVQQRAQVGVVARRGNEVLQLADLGTSATGWQQLKQQGAVYPMASAENVSFRNVNNTTIRNAVQRAAQKKRLSRREQQAWLDAVKNVRSVGQGPVQTALRAITWRIEAKDSRGRAVSKEVRVDVPL